MDEFISSGLWKAAHKAQDDLEEEVERLAHGICDVLDLIDPEDDEELEKDEYWLLDTRTAAALCRSLLKGTSHEGHRD